MPPLPELAGVFVLAMLAAFTQAVSGFGFSLFIVPPLAFLLGPKEAVVTANFLAVGVNVPVTFQNRAEVNWGLWGSLLTGSAIGMPLGLAVLLAVDARVLRAIIAVAVILSTILIWRRIRIGAEGRLADGVAGFVSGILNTSTSMSGPPVVLHLQSQGVQPGGFRASLAAYFMVASSVAVLLFALSGEVAWANLAQLAAGLPGIAAGIWLGNKVFRRLSGQRFRAIVILVLLLSGLSALLGAVT